jgi:hypothetical protein
MRRAERRGTETLADIARSCNVSQATVRAWRHEVELLAGGRYSGDCAQTADKPG